MNIRKTMENIPVLRIDPTDYADPLFGVGSATSAGPTLPAGSIHPSPETLEKDCGGYLREQPIVGFGQTYISGAGGTKCYGNYLLAPMLDDIEPDHSKRASFAVNGSEKAACYEYRVKLENGIAAKVTPAHNAAIYTFSYPAGREAVLLLDIAHKLDMDACMKEGTVTVDPQKRTFCGGGLYSGNWNMIDWNMYFAMEFDTVPTEIGCLSGGQLTVLDSGSPVTIDAQSLQRFGVYIRFGANAPTVNVKIAVSFVSEERAKEFLHVQIPAFDYDAVRDAAQEAWRNTLGVIELHTADTALLRRFYTAMYHMNIQPRDRTGDHGLWDDFHTVWDTWKTVFPMYALLYPQKMGSVIDSFIDRAHRNAADGDGIVVADEFMTAKEFAAGQGGNDVENAIADAFLKGVQLHRHTWEEAYAVLLESAEKMRSPEYVSQGFATENAVTVTGRPYTWRFKPAAATMGFAFNDKAIAAVAKELGTKAEYEKYSRRSANWLHVWNSENESEGFRGFPQNPRADGSFDEGFDAHGGYNSHFYEATGWDASYINYNDVPRLVEVMGGARTFTERLVWACEHSVNYFNDDHGKEGYLNFTNEPSFHIPWLFCTDEIRRPDLAAKVIDSIIKRFSKQNDYPGDEDNGGMSSYYVFLMCGIFPYATTENYYLHGTRLEEIVFHLGNGRELRITGENVGDGNIYVQSAVWHGEPLNRCRLTHRELIEGGELHFVMGAEPSDWATH
ncbi:MAG: glycoside hydrolase family 92 protein [Ruminococcaceae bacterium]|nr:glycoside hydrolase family 92 protein [Oscillospiraceae bacterium]